VYCFLMPPFPTAPSRHPDGVGAAVTSFRVKCLQPGETLLQPVVGFQVASVHSIDDPRPMVSPFAI
jgi:hypothetical protein